MVRRKRRGGGMVAAGWAIAVLLCGGTDRAWAQEPETVALVLEVQVPDSTPGTDVIGVVGDFQGWRHDDPAARLTRQADGIWTTTLQVRPGTLLRFRLHRGSAATEEARPDGSSVGERKLRVDGPRTVSLRVVAWRDDAPPARTIVGDVTEHSDPTVLDGRRMWVYLPPDYHRDERDHPMLLMLDGQNCFDRTTSFAGEWEVDETCERLIAAGRVEPLVVIAIDNGRGRRMAEYTPWPDALRGGGEGTEHLRRIVEEVLPWVRAHYRVRTAPADVGLVGSSLGGLMGLHVIATRPEVFGRVGALSPSIPWAEGRIVESLRGVGPGDDRRLWVDMGTLEYGRMRDEDGDGVDDLVAALRTVTSTLQEAGWGATQLRVVEDEGARHHESAWAARLPGVLEFLFPAR